MPPYHRYLQNVSESFKMHSEHATGTDNFRSPPRWWRNPVEMTGHKLAANQETGRRKARWSWTIAPRVVLLRVCVMRSENVIGCLKEAEQNASNTIASFHITKWSELCPNSQSLGLTIQGQQLKGIVFYHFLRLGRLFAKCIEGTVREQLWRILSKTRLELHQIIAQSKGHQLETRYFFQDHWIMSCKWNWRTKLSKMQNSKTFSWIIEMGSSVRYKGSCFLVTSVTEWKSEQTSMLLRIIQTFSASLKLKTHISIASTNIFYFCITDAMK